MPRLQSPSPVIAIVYSDGRAAARILQEIVDWARAGGHSCCGLLQHDGEAGRHGRCDAALDDLASHARTPIMEDRGPLARGCRLDVGALLAAMTRARAAIATRPDLVVVNKFGKTECEGGGLRPLVIDALEAGLPVLVAVPWGNIDSWRRFAGELATEHPAEVLAGLRGGALAAALGFLIDGQPAVPEPRPTTPMPPT